ncbi:MULTISPECIES: hypothetical protein [unclassified Streptomyces]|uniref:hypothetical protein n=1 Tax=unclassified Streptomyces TaxID=2593676 RepID=UPI0023ED9CBE|nr:hypothetical protein [Streptomyces sp. WMMB303]MDF4252201.1 hypothetical protein [Streptomyces sp. WMMB303]
MADPVKNSKGRSAKSAVETVPANGADPGARNAATGKGAHSAEENPRTKGEAAKDTLVSAGAKAGAAAAAGATVVKERRNLTAGTAGGLLALLAGAFALGRRTARNSAGPLTRWTRGRI